MLHRGDDFKTSAPLEYKTNPRNKIRNERTNERKNKQTKTTKITKTNNDKNNKNKSNQAMCKPASEQQNQVHGTRTSAELHVLACPLHVANFFERVDDLVLQRKIEESLAVDVTDSGTSS